MAPEAIKSDLEESGLKESSSAALTFRNRRIRRVGLFVVIAALLVVTSLASVVVGQYELPLDQLWPLLAAGPLNATDLDASVLWQIRLPRLVLGLFCLLYTSPSPRDS